MPDKGIEDLLYAFKIIKESHPELELKIFGEEIFDSRLRGKFTDHLKDMVKQIETELELNPGESGITFCGHVFPQNKIYEQIDLLILPSYREAFPMVMLEAAASSVPVIASNVGGIPEFITEGETGFMVPPKNAEALAKKIDYVFDNPEIVERCTKNARELVETKFTAKINADKLLKVYKELLED